MPTISGTVYDDTGDPAAGRIVRAYRRDTGALLGAAVTSDGLLIAGDPHYANVSLLLHGDDSFADNSPTPKTLTVANGAPGFSTSIKKFGSAAMDFSRTGAMTIPSGMDFGTGDFTVETWIYWVTAVGSAEWGAFQLSTPSSYARNQQNIAVLCGVGNVYAFYTGHGYLPSSKVITAGTWQQLEINRSGGRLRAFVEGVQILDVANTFNFANPSGVIGGYHSSYFNGNVLLDDFRVTKGVARHTANFTPPTAPHYDAGELPATPAGSYGITTAYTGEVQRIVLDDDAGTLYNDLIDRVIVE